MFNSSFSYKPLAGGYIRFSHDGSKNGTDSDYITEPSITSAISSSFNRKKLQLNFIQEIVIVKVIIIIKWLGTISDQIFLLFCECINVQ